MKKKVSKMIIKKIPIELYHQGIYFCITPDREEARKWFESHNISTHNFPRFTASAFTWVKEGYWPHVWIQSLKLTPKNLNTIGHELIHACWHILDDIHIKIAADNHEALTYLHGYFMERLLKKS